MGKKQNTVKKSLEYKTRTATKEREVTGEMMNTTWFEVGLHKWVLFGFFMHFFVSSLFFCPFALLY